MSDALLGQAEAKSSSGFSPEEEDNLARSNKKAKSGEKIKERKKTELFETTTRYALKRNQVSYRDAILSQDGGESGESSKADGDWSVEESDNESTGEEHSEEDDLQQKSGDPLCPEVHISH
ncbi:hypothetical protein SESBI_12288 [Sesbania bispinosa]|nr:hypothetical protein SESBI_12288 [Sesbania bispinosa]